MSTANRFQVANSNIIYDTMEGEVILLNLDTGTYYQVRHTGVLVWNLLATGVPLADIETRLENSFPNQASAIKTAVAQFVYELEQEKLVAPLASDAPPPANPPMLDTRQETNSTFLAPVLLKYTDMQSLLLLDPIHEIDSTGWPTAKEN